MFRLQLDQHQTLVEVIEKFISAMLPHKNAEGIKTPVILEKLTAYIKHEEFSAEYYVLINLIQQITDISAQTLIPMQCTKEHLETYLSQEKLITLVRLDGIGIHSLAETSGHHYDPAIPTHVINISRLLYNKIKELYERCYALAINPNECLAYIPALREAYLNALGSEALRAQEHLLNATLDISKYTYTGWSEFLRYKSYKGPEGWIVFQNDLMATINARICQGVEADPYVTLSKIQKFKESYKRSTEYIAYYELPSLDKYFGITRVGFTVLAGPPKVGKTTMAAHLAAKILCNEGAVVFFSKENDDDTVITKHILPPYVKEKYGFYTTPEQITKVSPVTGKTEEEVEIRKKGLAMAEISLTENKKLRIIRNLTMENFERDIRQMHQSDPFDFLVLDHAFLIAGSDRIELEKLSSLCVSLKSELKIHILLLSHTASDWKNILTGLSSTVTKNCGQFQGDVDFMLVMWAEEDQKPNKEAQLIAYLARAENDPTERHYIQLIPTSGVYEPLYVDEKTTVDEALKELDKDNPFAEDEDDDDEYDEDEDDDEDMSIDF